MRYQTELKMTLVYDTDGDPNVIVNELLNLFQIVDTTRLNLTWDDCDWDTNPASEYCLECGAHDPMQDEPQWHKSDCSINEGE